MTHGETIARIVAARRRLVPPGAPLPLRPGEAEGGCGVIGIACSEPLPGRHLLQSLVQMRNRGNGKGGGAALVGLDPSAFGVPPHVLRDDYFVVLAYLDPTARAEIERAFIEPVFTVDHVHRFPVTDVPGVDIRPPEAVGYFVRVRREALEMFAAMHDLGSVAREAVADELVYQNSYRLNQAYYASLGEKRAFVLSHGKDLLVLKMVGFGDDVIRAYGLDDVRAHVWIGHHRYPTKGRVWHPGGAHPFVGMHEALVHNGDFANYASMCAYLAQRNIRPLFLTDTEVSVLVFDLLHRTYGYPLEYVIESLAPTTERDFTLLPPEKQAIYGALQTTHVHGSPDGPWFFLIAQSLEGNGNGHAAPSARVAADAGVTADAGPNGAGHAPRAARLIGITDTSMLRPQVFALQDGGPGEPAIGFAASEKQAIDAALASLAAEDARFWACPDRVWNARGSSHTDGGAFVFTVERTNDRNVLVCTDKFGRPVTVGETAAPYRPDAVGRSPSIGRAAGEAPRPVVPGGIGSAAPRTGSTAVQTVVRPTPLALASPEEDGATLAARAIAGLPTSSYAGLIAFLDQLVSDLDGDASRARAIDTLTTLVDRRYATGALRRSAVVALCDEALGRVFEAVRSAPTAGFAHHTAGAELPSPADAAQAVVVDARGFEPDGPRSLALELAHLVSRGFRRLIVAGARGHRFIGNGLGPKTDGVRIDVHGSSGDYLASGIDGATVVVHGSGQDQLAQIMKRGRLVVHGDVGQTFMYAAKGGEVFVLGHAAGRPLINAVGRPRVVINGTCLDYLAESFMAGDPLAGGGFVILNGVSFAPDGRLVDLDTPYPGGNLFSLASGGAIFVRDPRRLVGEDQLNGGEFAEFDERCWARVRPLLEENERLFGIPVSRLLTLDGEARPPEQVYRAILPARHEALQPEEAWVRQQTAHATGEARAR